MLTIKNVSVRAFCVAIRWCKMAGYPEILNDWTKEQSEQLQKVAEEYDKRQKLRH